MEMEMMKPLALIVEDDHMLADIFSRTLMDIDYETMIMPDGLAALRWLNHHVPDLLVLDMHLPHVSGEKVLKKIHKDARFEMMRIMVVTADAAMAAQLEGYITLTLIKPVDLVDMQKLSERLKPRHLV
jgi:DNA-binding response OmpR family regulator